MPVTPFAASANAYAYSITELASPPSLTNPGWSLTPPTNYIFSGTGTRTAYAWVSDAYGNVSSSATQMVTITPAFNESDFTSPLPPSFFGQNITDEQDWPSAPFGAIRIWNAPYSWDSIETSEGVYNWTALDQALAYAKAANVDVLYTMGRTPSWAASTYTAPPSDVSSGDNYWKAFVTALVEHSLASPTAQISYYEIWNEPNTTDLVDRNRRSLATMAQDAYTIIHTLDPSAKVIGPPASTPSWYSGYYAAGGAPYEDIVGYHAYVGTNAATMLGLDFGDTRDNGSQRSLQRTPVEHRRKLGRE